MIRGAYRGLYSIVQRMSAATGNNYATAQIAPLQKAALEERCILVDDLDRSVGEATKRACHEINMEGDVLLHRAFSVFLFNSKGELLLQKRSKHKITFPDHYTNTCCSHPLAEIPGETVEEDAIGIRRAAVRRLSYELGIPSEEIQPTELLYLTRIHYKAVSDSRWGEHEIDYMLFLQKDVTIDPNPDEVSEVRWVTRSEIESPTFLKTVQAPLTPWFQLILKYKLLQWWWDNLETLDKMQDVDNITVLS
ncbi:PREDICTED: isopentenyl-diphosphate Delta-isomerase 1-like [Dinoponera quadriceps]|uniref:isopentenyl-diphosphate Delta-isomerase n=1 Tax=Dinoponera quadriceps TaxID=609295 RepID=A0A6P3XGU9_DINQU|nr:PREDICTED: isopentenyl-diphosphate Delta-isomerase 1-like [Dinoponera quadriceps]